ncbi:hypothetical protein BABINDRAFT_163785 [Babjeviella inositovora NRRL Y-12698]|uniref:Uncharacterized protein n=1 Tax=Babjeviella inositovora NRRL Y-12698 TaxID=984486 RepID=A0A1E3QJ07_9ASCO|nr:uncharacterized protein BABINDRAFT_163785 [Babjeviella inositovora NRRL Y-12698]ODQ77052.1 hypothetical protein BABINDRAFT_163785 [Babjeviella inositovora NRRL Y-12698]
MFAQSARFAVTSASRMTTRRSYATASTGSSIKGSLVGFLSGITVTGAASYFYLIDETKNANSAVLGDVLDLQSSIKTLEECVKALEEKSK